MIPLRFGCVSVQIQGMSTRTVFPDGLELRTPHGNDKDHDLTCSLLAHWLGLQHSPSLHRRAAQVLPTQIDQLEETAVAAIQAYAAALGVDLVFLARRITAETGEDPS